MDRIVNSSLGEKITYLLWGPPATLSGNGSIAKWASRTLQKIKPKPHLYVSFENANSSTTYFDLIWALENNRSRETTKTWLSTGFFSVVTALNFCDSVTIFGLDAQNSCENNSTKQIRVMDHFYTFRFLELFCCFLYIYIYIYIFGSKNFSGSATITSGNIVESFCLV